MFCAGCLDYLPFAAVSFHTSTVGSFFFVKLLALQYSAMTLRLKFAKLQQNLNVLSQNCDWNLFKFQALLLYSLTFVYFTTIAGIGATQYDEQFVVLFSLTMAQLKQVS